MFRADIVHEDGTVLGEIKITEGKNGPWLKCTSFVCEHSQPLHPDDADDIKKIVSRSDWRGLYNFNHELNPWYCPECDRMYTGDQWFKYQEFESDGWYDCTTGRCPDGHSRMLDD